MSTAIRTWDGYYAKNRVLKWEQRSNYTASWGVIVRAEDLFGAKLK